MGPMVMPFLLIGDTSQGREAASSFGCCKRGLPWPKGLTMGALIVTYTILGVPYSKYGIIYPKTIGKLLRPLYYSISSPMPNPRTCWGLLYKFKNSVSLHIGDGSKLHLLLGAATNRTGAISATARREIRSPKP